MKPLILIDTREQTPWKFSENVATEVTTLETADYSIAGIPQTVAVERKSLSDLVQCVTFERDRFLDCCRRMKDYDFKLLVVEASVADVLAAVYRSRTNPQSVIGTTVALHADFGIPTLWAGDARTAANMTERIFARMWRRHNEARAA